MGRLGRDPIPQPKFSSGDNSSTCPCGTNNNSHITESLGGYCTSCYEKYFNKCAECQGSGKVIWGYASGPTPGKCNKCGGSGKP